MTFGVSPKSANAARLAFEKSARIAGFFPTAAEDRLVMPVTMPSASLGGDAMVQPIPAAVPSPTPQPAELPKVLEYQLIDLLTLDGIGESESQAIWTLVRFLAARRKDA